LFTSQNITAGNNSKMLMALLASYPTIIDYSL